MALSRNPYDRYKLPIVSGTSFASYGVTGDPGITSSETIHYSYEMGRYYTESDMRRIRELEEEVKEKKQNRKNDLQSIISYFYRNR